MLVWFVWTVTSYYFTIWVDIILNPRSSYKLSGMCPHCKWWFNSLGNNLSHSSNSSTHILLRQVAIKRCQSGVVNVLVSTMPLSVDPLTTFSLVQVLDRCEGNKDKKLTFGSKIQDVWMHSLNHIKAAPLRRELFERKLWGWWLHIQLPLIRSSLYQHSPSWEPQQLEVCATADQPPGVDLDAGLEDCL